jgi:transcription elongation factor Elf1
MQRIYNILVSILGESKQGSYDNGTTQYQFNCPFCADEKGGVDNKYNLEISFSLGKFHCWSCGSSGSLSKLIRARGGSSLCDEYFSILNDIKENKYYNLDMFKDNGDLFEEKYLKLPKTFQKIDLYSCRDKELKAYLEKRKITQDLIDYYNIGRTTWDEEDWTWRNRIIFPSYNSAGDLNYYIGRTYRSKDKRNKYKNCDADKNKIILHEDKIQWDADIYLVEGAIDCIYYPNSVSLMGKTMNKSMELYSKLKERANANIIICLDGDTTIDEVKRIYNTLNRGRLFGKIKYIRLGEGLNGRYVPYENPVIDGEEIEVHPIVEDVEDLSVHADYNPQNVRLNGKIYTYEGYKDFGEVYESEGKRGIIKAMRTAKQFSEIELLV